MNEVIIYLVVNIYHKNVEVKRILIFFLRGQKFEFKVLIYMIMQ